MAQKKTITGVVTDATGEAVIGASIVETGTTNGTVTDLDGNFTLSVANDGSIRVSFIGYQTQTLSVKGKSTFKIALKEDSEMLQEVVVTGYGGKQLRTKVTNSISKVKEETLKQGLYSNPAQALSGAVAGLSVSQTSGNPGSTPTLVLRGGTNFDGSGSPLILIDGQVRSSLSDINPDDIESMEVLKDAGATAIYGARANDGVILVTTKRGKSGRAEVNLKAKFGLNYFKNSYEFLDAGDYIYWMRMGYKNAYMGDMIQETAKTSERLTDKLRRMTLEIVVNPKEYEKYKEDLVLIHGIELEYKDEILRVSAPVLIPHRKDCYTDYLYKPLHTAFRNWCMQRAEEKLEIPTYTNCTICFVHVYDETLPLARVRDHDNYEEKHVQDIITNFFLQSDSGLYTNTCHVTRMGEEDRTLLYVMDSSKFPAWISDFGKETGIEKNHE